jgi:hypothetical protein
MKKRKHKTRQTTNNEKTSGNDRLSSPRILADPSPPPDDTSPERLPGEMKRSQLLLKVAEPFLERYGKTYERVHGILHLAVIAWNLSVLPEEREEEILKEITDVLPKVFSAQDIVVVIDKVYMMKNRKRELFHDIQEVITKIDLRRTETGFDLTVFSAPVKVLKDRSVDGAAD